MNAWPRRGFVYWVRVPDEPDGKRRPALVISSDTRNRLASDVIVIPLSTHVMLAPTHVTLRKGEAGLPERSVAKCEQVTTIVKARLLDEPLGSSLSEARMRAVVEGLLRAVDVVVQERAG